MSLTFVAHNTLEPAIYGAMAGVLASQRGVELAHLNVEWDTQRYADACQHVTAAGDLVTSGLLWYERLSGKSAGRVWQLDDLLSLHGAKDWIIPLGPSQLASFTRLAREVRNYSVDYQLVEVEHSRQGYQFHRLDSLDGAPNTWWRDSFGRFTQRHHTQQSSSSRRLRIALIGTYQDQLESYPATLASLGDAAEAQGTLTEIVFIPPRSSEHVLQSTLKDIDGVILPGGSDMQNVAGQIRVAHYCLKHGIPTLGLCLGMQTMATAVIQQMSGDTQANLAEADPQAAVKTFIPLGETAGRSLHRLGDNVMKMRSGSQMASILGERSTIRYNHRFQLNPQFKDSLENYGLAISATCLDGAIADGIEYASHPFYVAVQGHPELTSTSENPHPLMRAFLQAAADA
ncbi:glutamine amidotransferase-related protein [Rouxiella badensis]|jgi:CTP synthase|uniref:glutamine amidotransferase-related protein n=1 Tax=Rouxiella badensis TaxID=1646377 RepID=UPI001CE3C903|nr:gamma-glutamyl-gamma-aminobutyrate hydrolase family protein [Rouxiella badensis]